MSSRYSVLLGDKHKAIFPVPPQQATEPVSSLLPQPSEAKPAAPEVPMTEQVQPPAPLPVNEPSKAEENSQDLEISQKTASQKVETIILSPNDGMTANRHDSTPSSQQDVLPPSPHDSMTARRHDPMLAKPLDVLTLLKQKATEKTTVRLPVELIEKLDETLYLAKRTYRTKLSMNSIFIVALASFCQDFEEHGAASSLFKIIQDAHT